MKMERDSTKIFIVEFYSTPPKKNYESIMRITKSVDDTWSSGLSDMNDSGSNSNKCCIFILVVFEKHSKIAWTIPLRSICSKSITDGFHKLLKHRNSNQTSPRQTMVTNTLAKLSMNSQKVLKLKDFFVILIKGHCLLKDFS